MTKICARFQNSPRHEETKNTSRIRKRVKKAFHSKVTVFKELISSGPYYICDLLSNLVPFVQFKKREKHPWCSVTFSKVACFKPATLRKVALLHGYFSRFLNCKNGTKSCKISHMFCL